MTRIHTKLVYQWVDDQLVLIHEEGFDYSGSIALCKGDPYAQQNEIMQMNFNQALMGIFQKQFDKQSQIFDFLKGKLQPMIDNPTGFSPEQNTLLHTGATEGISQQYQNATQAIQNKEFAQGGRDLPSGVNAQISSQLATGQAHDVSNANNQISLADENLKQTNYWNAISALSGQQALLNPMSYANGATSGGEAVAGLSQAVTASQSSGLLGGILGGVMGMGSAALGNPNVFKGCWIAAAVYEDGWKDTRTQIVREWLNTEFTKTMFGKAVMSLYWTVGEPVSWFVKRSSLLRSAFEPLFNLALDKAVGLA